ncbi:hypothetical protein CEQ90_13750 [Lewinellaceae bacterium SD302]|nr:hypothetical protein CEQ90_13750 [Lewinellaceae bacterium SD302]
MMAMFSTTFLRRLLTAGLLLLTVSLAAQEFVNPFYTPPQAVTGFGYISLDKISTTHNFSPMGSDSLNVGVSTYAYEDFNSPGTTTILGPTLVWQYQDNLTLDVLNRLDEPSGIYFQGVNAVAHQIGGVQNTIAPDGLTEYSFKIENKPTTLWYHPLVPGETAEQVQRGFGGMIIVEDQNVDATLSFWHDVFPTNYGVDDIPVIVQTKKFRRNEAGVIEIQADQGYNADYTYLVNGSVDPVLNVGADMIRLRFLNADAKFAFNLGVTSDLAGQNTQDLQLIAVDGGYTTQSRTKSEVLVGAGETFEVLIDLRGLEGQTFYLFNRVSAMPDGVIGNSTTTSGYATDRALMKIEVGPSTTISPIIGFPLNIYFDPDRPSQTEVSNTRMKVLRQDPLPAGNIYNVDSVQLDTNDVIDIVMQDSVEVWTIDNTTDIAHPWHLHGFKFWVTEIMENGTPLDLFDYPEITDGPQTSVFIRPGWTLSYITRFNDFGTQVSKDSSYLFQSGNLQHFDKGMAGQFVVWNGEESPSSLNNPNTTPRDMELFPNPTAGTLHLKGNSAKASILHVLDINGRLLREIRLAPFQGSTELNVSGLPAGTLVLDWRSAEGRAVRRVTLH